jgi:ADP-ribose pyrophosphatase YjhB (NUDIX family)
MLAAIGSLAGSRRRQEPHVTEPQIRVIALGVLLLHDHVLFSEGHDAVKGWDFLRPIGGGVEFGELAAAAVVREFEEETGLEVEIRASLGVVENPHEYLGERQHQIAFEYVMRFPADAAPPDLPALEVDEGDHVHAARWVPLAEVLAGMHPLVPEGLHERLAAWVNRQ